MSVRIIINVSGVVRGLGNNSKRESPASLSDGKGMEIGLCPLNQSVYIDSKSKER